MFGKHFLLALLIAYSSNFALTHIVTSAHTDLTTVKCINSLANMVQTTLCPIFGQFEPNSMEDTFDPALEPLERRSREFRDNMKRCCSRPCTIPELVAVC